MRNSPDYEQRQSQHGQDRAYAYSLETGLRSAGQDSALLSPEVLLVHNVNSHTVILLCEPGGPITSLAPIEAFNQHWSTRFTGQYAVDTLTCQRYEIQGQLFDNQAALILNQQLKNLEALRLPTTLGLTTLQALYAELCNRAYYFTDAAHVDPVMANVLRQGVMQLKDKGHELRIALSLHLPPTDGNLQFLFDQALVQVARRLSMCTVAFSVKTWPNLSSCLWRHDRHRRLTHTKPA
ncbi:hypothetical protein GIR22_07575 [Pseudomonas sp. CCM 7891]|uniref:Uncharacterized protein n=1 Tax=Pseudomonas karstica TaxID=1055468 RepID=A0A7X2RTM7_9PSED|nr:hypothetical protein [Pseudomonas karstica]MTD19010.1 hypothetical protein [Pseudomonas karstica]